MPDYKRIYSDMLEKNYPHKQKECLHFLQKKSLTSLDIIRLNQQIFGITDKEKLLSNQKLRSYNKEAILEILNYQSKNSLNNSQLALKFSLSRNTVTKWKKIYLKEY